jgi:hypothetical protein
MSALKRLLDQHDMRGSRSKSIRSFCWRRDRPWRSFGRFCRMPACGHDLSDLEALVLARVVGDRDQHPPLGPGQPVTAGGGIETPSAEAALYR